MMSHLSELKALQMSKTAHIYLVHRSPLITALTNRTTTDAVDGRSRLSAVEMIIQAFNTFTGYSIQNHMRLLQRREGIQYCSAAVIGLRAVPSVAHVLISLVLTIGSWVDVALVTMASNDHRNSDCVTG